MLLIKKGNDALKKDFEEIPVTAILENIPNNNSTDYEKFQAKMKIQFLKKFEAEKIQPLFIPHIIKK